MIHTEHLHNGLLYFDTPIKDYVYTWNIQAPNYRDMKDAVMAEVLQHHSI